VHLAQRHPRGAGVITAHTVRAVHDRVVDRELVAVVALLEPPLLGALELRAGEVVVDLRDRAVRVAGAALGTGVGPGTQVHRVVLGEHLDRLELLVSVRFCRFERLLRRCVS
jgi:hypothetical protein